MDWRRMGLGKHGPEKIQTPIFPLHEVWDKEVRVMGLFRTANMGGKSWGILRTCGLARVKHDTPIVNCGLLSEQPQFSFT